MKIAEIRTFLVNSNASKRGGRPRGGNWIFCKIICEDGKKYEGSVTAPRGDPVYPLSDEELHRKYQDLAIQVLPSHVVEKIEQHLQELEWIDDIKKLTQLLRLD